MNVILQAFLLSLAASATLTLVCRKLARRYGFVARPVADRWSVREVALGGGIAMALVILLGGLFLSREIVLGLLPALALVFALGLVDDLFGVSPAVKLLGQTVAAAYLVAQGFVFPVISPVIAIPVTVVLLVGVCNAVNLVDNMDGLAAGVVLIVALALGRFALPPDSNLALFAVIVAGAAGGFLLHNSSPAKVFMGDAGSLTLGLALGALSTQVRFEQPIPEGLNLIPACMLLVVPLFDTLLVTISRTSALRPITQGGRDHTSHRLVSLGLNDRRAVYVLYAFAVFGGACASAVLRGTYASAVPVTLLFVVVCGTLLLFLLDVRVYSAEPAQPGKVYPLPVTVVTLIEIAMDVGVITLAWMGAHYVRFAEGGLESYKLTSVIPLLPYLIALKLLCLASFQLYRGLWRSLTLGDIYRMFKAVTLASLAVIALLALMRRLDNVSRVVILVDYWLTFLGVVGTRAAFTAFGRWSRRLSIAPKRVAFVGDPSLLPGVREALAKEAGCELIGVIPLHAQSHPAALGVLKDVAGIVDKEKIDILLVIKNQTGLLSGPLSSTSVKIRSLSLQLG